MTRDGFRFYTMYVAITRHFAKGNYDYFKYHGKVNTTPEQYNKRSDVYSFEKATKVIPEADWQDFIVSNLVNSDKCWIRYMTKDNMSAWQRRMDSMPVLFKHDCEFLATYDLNDLITGPNTPKICNLAMQGQINIETLCIFEHVIEFIDGDYHSTPVWPAHKLKVKRYTPFILQKIGDLAYYTDIMRDILIARKTDFSIT